MDGSSGCHFALSAMGMSVFLVFDRSSAMIFKLVYPSL